MLGVDIASLPDVNLIRITETWFREQDSSMYLPNSFTDYIKKPRFHRKSGGLLLDTRSCMASSDLKPKIETETASL